MFKQIKHHGKDTTFEFKSKQTPACFEFEIFVAKQN